jgi:D-glycero-D-manno-heptose 1,7-bisphosphate phosphatase
MHRKLQSLLPLDRIEVCYDSGHEATPSPNRKPAPGMLLRAAQELNIDLSHSFMVGDRWRDIDCGYAAGCRTVFIDWGYCEELRHSPDFHASNLSEATDWILQQD